MCGSKIHALADEKQITNSSTTPYHYSHPGILIFIAQCYSEETCTAGTVPQISKQEYSVKSLF